MNDFKVGDIVRAKKTEDGREIYAYTNSSVRCIVMCLEGTIGMRVEILDGWYKGTRYSVAREHFYKTVNRTE